MERLTKRINGVVVYVGAKNPYSTGQIPCEVEPAGVREMMDRLAAYEDTRLSPQAFAEAREAGKVLFTKKNMCAILVPLRDKYGLTDRQVLAVARNELSLEELMLL